MKFLFDREWQLSFEKAWKPATRVVQVNETPPPPPPTLSLLEISSEGEIIELNAHLNMRELWNAIVTASLPYAMALSETDVS